jgi:hypothetical protein
MILEADNDGNTRDRRDVNSSRTPATTKHSTEGTPTTEIPSTVVTPGAEVMLTTAWSHQQQKRQ